MILDNFTRHEALQEDLSVRGGQAAGWSNGGRFASGFGHTEPPVDESGRDTIDLRLALLARAIEHEIIPRLMKAHRAPNECLTQPVARGPGVTRRDVEKFTRLVLSKDDGVAQACIEAMRERGISVETIYLDLLAPVARHLGELWEQDLCDFTDVTIGLGRLHQVLRELSPAFGHAQDHPGNGRRILLLPSPGEQHTFGLVMVSEFFRRAGWDVAGSPWEAGADPVVMVRREWFDAVGFSLAAELHVDDLCECIQAVRRAARNMHLGILVGGPIFGEQPDLVARVGADGVTTDGRQAPALAEQVITRLKRGC